MQPLFSLSPIAIYSLAFIAGSVIWLGLVLVLRRTTLRRSTVLFLVGLGITIRVALLPLAPIGSDDIFRYMWDGRVQSHGIDPYAFAPGDSALSALHTQDLPARVNHPAVRTPYLPFTQWIFRVAYHFAGEDTRGIKTLLLLAECLTLVILSRLLKLLGAPAQHLLLYALCPLPIIQFGLDGHIDGLGIPLMLGAILLLMQERRAFALILLGLSISIKPVGLVLLPVIIFSEKAWKWKIMGVIIPFLTVFLQFLPYFSSSDPFNGIMNFGRNWSYNGALFDILYAILGNNPASRIVCVVILAAGIIAVAQKHWKIQEAAYVSILVLLLCSPVVHPWYVGWLAALLPLAFAWSGGIFVAAASLTSVTVVQYQTTGLWTLSPWILVLEYVPVVVLFLLELRKNRRISHDIR